jgi:hypothetical protein
MARLHDALKDLGHEGHALGIYLVRLLICLFADDTLIFPQAGLRHVRGAPSPAAPSGS